MIAELVADQGIKIAISANWRFVIPSSVLRLFSGGILNLHVGGLPDYKGNATANWAILAGESEIYADVHFMVPELDAGNVRSRKALPLTGSTYIGDVVDWVQAQARDSSLGRADSALSDPERFVVRGSTGGLRCYPRLAQDGNIDWTQSAVQVCRLVRASSRPYPGAFSWHRDRQLIVWRASVMDYSDPFPRCTGSGADRRSARPAQSTWRAAQVCCASRRSKWMDVRLLRRSDHSVRDVFKRRYPHVQPEISSPVAQLSVGAAPHDLKLESASV